MKRKIVPLLRVMANSNSLGSLNNINPNGNINKSKKDKTPTSVIGKKKNSRGGFVS